jgi:hypothetical protein
MAETGDTRSIYLLFLQSGNTYGSIQELNQLQDEGETAQQLPIDETHAALVGSAFSIASVD